MLGHYKMSLERGYIAINPVSYKLITSLRTAVAEENTLDKESTTYPDILDAYRLVLKDYKFIIKEIEDEEIKTVIAKPNSIIDMPNVTTRLGQYCFVHGYYYEEEYLECDYCNEHKSLIC
jgi:hypothetical protein